MVNKRVSGFCPETGEVRSIEIEFTGMDFAGGQGRSYKAIRYRCSYLDGHECVCRGADGRDCPLFKQGKSMV